MKTEILFFEISAYKIPYTNKFSFDRRELIENVNKNIISNWQP